MNNIDGSTQIDQCCQAQEKPKVKLAKSKLYNFMRSNLKKNPIRLRMQRSMLNISDDNCLLIKKLNNPYKEDQRVKSKYQIIYKDVKQIDWRNLKICSREKHPHNRNMTCDLYKDQYFTKLNNKISQKPNMKKKFLNKAVISLKFSIHSNWKLKENIKKELEKVRNNLLKSKMHRRLIAVTVRLYFIRN